MPSAKQNKGNNMTSIKLLDETKPFALIRFEGASDDLRPIYLATNDDGNVWIQSYSRGKFPRDIHDGTEIWWKLPPITTISGNLILKQFGEKLDDVFVLDEDERAELECEIEGFSADFNLFGGGLLVHNAWSGDNGTEFYNKYGRELPDSDDAYKAKIFGAHMITAKTPDSKILKIVDDLQYDPKDGYIWELKAYIVNIRDILLK
jgi:hypothetical protein